MQSKRGSCFKYNLRSLVEAAVKVASEESCAVDWDGDEKVMELFHIIPQADLDKEGASEPEEESGSEDSEVGDETDRGGEEEEDDETIRERNRNGYAFQWFTDGGELRAPIVRWAETALAGRGVPIVSIPVESEAPETGVSSMDVSDEEKGDQEAASVPKKRRFRRRKAKASVAAAQQSGSATPVDGERDSPEQPKKKRTRSKMYRGGEERKRAGKKHKVKGSGSGEAAEGSGGPGAVKKACPIDSLRERHFTRGLVLKAEGFSVTLHGSRTSTGWHGVPGGSALKEIREWYKDGSLEKDLQCFQRVPHDLGKHPTFLLDDEGRTSLVRTSVLAVLLEKGDELGKLFHELLAPSLTDESVRLSNENGPRGSHFPCILGYARSYTSAPVLTEWHRKNSERVDTFLGNEAIQTLIRVANKLVWLFFPNIAKRYLDCVEDQVKRFKIKPYFGIWLMFCINGLFPGQERVHTVPHTDHKNVVGVCLLIVYELPGFKFDHKSKSWLVIWEAGVILELPPWVAVLYPSSLFTHFNVDIEDAKIITTMDGSRPTPETKGCEGRGSLVFFNQGSMFMSAETGCKTLGEARDKGISSVRDFGKDAQAAFEEYTSPFRV